MCPRIDSGSLPRLAIQSVCNSTVSLLLSYFSFNTLSLEIFFKILDTFGHLVLSLLKFLLSMFIVFICLCKVEFELGCLTLSFHIHVDLPVLNPFSKPFFHEASIALQLVNLDPTHLLFLLRIINNIFVVKFGCLGCLCLHFIVKLLQVRFEVNVLLSSIQLADTLFKKVVGDLVVLWFGLCDSLGGLVVTKSASLRYNRDVGWWVNFLQTHLQLVQ